MQHKLCRALSCSSAGDRNWAQQLESSFAAHSIGGGGGGGSSRGRDSAGGYDSGPSQRDSRKHKDTMVTPGLTQPALGAPLCFSPTMCPALLCSSSHCPPVA